MTKYNIGEKVRIIKKWSGRGKYIYIYEMDPTIGKIGEIQKIENGTKYPYYLIKFSNLKDLNYYYYGNTFWYRGDVIGPIVPCKYRKTI
jgi:hypothetical protein